MLRSSGSLLLSLLAITQLGCPSDDDYGQCPHPQKEAFYPVGCGPESCTLLAGCTTGATQYWHDASGALVHVLESTEYFDHACTYQDEARVECEDRCLALAQVHGAIDANCDNVYEAPFWHWPNGLELGCAYYEQCDADDHPFPGQLPTPPPAYCIADPSQNPDAPAAELFELRFSYDTDSGPDGEAIELPETCGYPVAIPADASDDFCQTWCEETLLPQYHQPDDPTLEHNCDTFVEGSICAYGQPPDDGGDFVWQTSSGGLQPSPLVCDEACCEAFGPAACYNFRGLQEPVHIAGVSSPLNVRVKLTSGTSVTQTTLVGGLTYAAPTCTAKKGATCPLYLETLTLKAPSPVAGVVHLPGAAPITFQMTNLQVDLTQPALGGWRPTTRQHQLQHHSLSLRVATHINAGAPGFASGPRTFMATNESAVTGTISSSGVVSLSGSVKIADGVVLTFSPP